MVHARVEWWRRGCWRRCGWLRVGPVGHDAADEAEADEGQERPRGSCHGDGEPDRSVGGYGPAGSLNFLPVDREAAAAGSDFEPGDEEEHVVLRSVFVKFPTSCGGCPWGGVVRPIVCVDVETSGPVPEVHEVVEVAWWSFATGVGDVFIPPHTLAGADPRALAVNRYWTRGLSDQTLWDDGSGLRRFSDAISGCLVVGSNPGFDWAFLRQVFVAGGLDVSSLAYPPLDLGTWGAGVLGRSISERVGLSQLCRVLGVVPGDHSAGDDVRACCECLVELQRRRVDARRT